MDLNFLTEYYMPVVAAACLIVGYCVKHITWLEKVSNQYIPAVLAALGAVLACMASSSTSLEVMVAGAFSGLASTGLHQTFKNIIQEKREEP